MTQRFPLQPIITDEHGNRRFRQNKIVRHLLDCGGLDLNRLSVVLRGDNCREDWEQFAQLIGYSVSGFGDLSYVSQDTVAIADAMAENPTLTEEQARIEHLEELLATARKHARELACGLFRVCPEDLYE